MSKQGGSRLSDKDFKEQGNKYFNAGKYEAAIESYSKAIALNPVVSVYYTNRALCYMKNNKWAQAVADSRSALERDSGLVKGHFYLGTALLEMDKLDESISHLGTALDLAKKEAGGYYDDTIWSKLRLARKKKWSQQEEKRLAQEIELQAYINRLVLEDRDRQIQAIKDPEDDDVAKVEAEADTRVAEVNSLFGKVDDRRMRREVPDYLCGKISFEILREPVITPSGITYDRADITEHLERVGHFDPVTRTKLTQDMLVPNYAMKEAVDDFVTKNEWANYY